jgi:hypothetical protein
VIEGDGACAAIYTNTKLGTLKVTEGEMISSE